MKAIIKISLLVTICTCNFCCLKAQYQDSIKQNKRAIDSTLIIEHLDYLRGLPETFYTHEIKQELLLCKS